MNNKFKIFFLSIWLVTTVVISLNIFYIGLLERWIFTLLNYLYVASLISLFINYSFLLERTTHSEKLIEAKNYNLEGILLIVAIVTGLLLYIGFKSSVILIMAICTFLLSIWIVIKYQKKITKQLIVTGLILGVLSCLLVYKYIPSLIAIFVTIPFFFIAGSLLNERFPVTLINLNKHQFSNGIKSFFIGCFFGLPMAMSNLSDVLSTSSYKWINQVWQLVLPLSAVTLEETWVRLFVISFIYALISSKTNKRYISISSAILISSILFGFTHSSHVDTYNCFNITIIYGFPLGILLYKRDFETVLGYHFIIDFVAAIAAVFINNKIVSL